MYAVKSAFNTNAVIASLIAVVLAIFSVLFVSGSANAVVNPTALVAPQNAGPVTGTGTIT